MKTIDFAQISAHLLNANGELGPELGFDIARSEGRWVHSGRELRVIMPFRITITRSGDGAPMARVAEISIVVRLAYEFANGTAPEEAELQHFAAISGFMHAWPYLRAEVQALSTKLGFPPLTLPVVLSGHAEQFVNMARLEDPGVLPAAEAVSPRRRRRGPAKLPKKRTKAHGGR